MTETKEVKDLRLNMSRENSEAVRRICSITGEPHRKVVERLLAAEESRLRIREISKDDAAFLGKIIKLYDTCVEMTALYAKEHSVLTESITEQHKKQVESLQKTIDVLTEKDAESQRAINIRDEEICELRDMINHKNEEIARLSSENERLLKNAEIINNINEAIKKMGADKGSKQGINAD